MFRLFLGCFVMTENRYVYKDRYRRERHQLHRMDEDMRFNDEVDKWDRHVVERQKQRGMLHRQHLLIA
jgi:hypothetical protein